jgi:hypothetical protein
MSKQLIAQVIQVEQRRISISLISDCQIFQFQLGDGAFSLDNIDPYLCTHLIYAFTSDIALNSTSFGPTQIPYDKLLAPRVKNPKLKIMASIKCKDNIKYTYSSLMLSTIFLYIQKQLKI